MNIKKIEVLKYCLTCDNLCKESCNSYNITNNRFFTPKNRALNIYDFIKNRAELDNELLYSCLHCSGCKKVCPHGNDISEITLLAKEEAILFNKVDQYIVNFEEEFYINDDSIYPNFDLDKIEKKYDLSKYKNSSNTIFIPGGDTLFYVPEKVKKIYTIFSTLSLNPSLKLFKSDSYLELYYLGYTDEVITDLKKFLRSLKNVNLIVTSSLNLLELFHKIAPLTKIKIPKIIDLYTYLITNGLKPKKKDSFIFINNSITKSFNSRILEKFSNNVTFINETSYPITDITFKLFYYLKEEELNRYIKRELDYGKKIVVLPDEESKKIFNKNRIIKNQAITLLDLIF